MIKSSTFPSVPPPDEAGREQRLPEPVTGTLRNGLKIVLVESHQVPMVTMRLLLPHAGEVADPPELVGLAAASARLLTAGTPTRTSFEIAEEADRYGGSIGASAESDYATVTLSCLSFYLRPMLALLADVLKNASYPPQEVEIDRANTLQRLNLQRSQPGFLASERFAKVLFQSHPYSILAPEAESVQRWQPEDLQGFHAMHHKPVGATLVLVGDVEPRVALDWLEESLGEWQGEAEQAVLPPIPPPHPRQALYLVERPGSVQSNIQLGNLCPTRTDPGFIPLKIGVTALGGGASSRLFLTVREKYGYAYSVGGRVNARKAAATFTAEAQTATENTEDAIRQILKETERMVNEPIPPKELEDTKTYLLGQFALEWITQGGIADMMMRTEIFGLPGDYWRNYPEQVRAVTPQMVQEVAARHLQTQQMAIVVVGEGEQLKELTGRGVFC